MHLYSLLQGPLKKLAIALCSLAIIALHWVTAEDCAYGHISAATYDNAGHRMTCRDVCQAVL